MREMGRPKGSWAKGEESALRKLTERVHDLEAQFVLTGAAGARNVIADAKLATFAHSIYCSRKRRHKLFERALFGEPAWDMLLDLFISHTRGRRVSTTSLCFAANAPITTGLRWINVLKKYDLVRRYHVLDDGRLSVIEITPKGCRLMREYLTEEIKASDKSPTQ